MSRRRDESGQTTLMIIGLAFVLVMLIAMVTDVSAAYLQRQGLDTLADGAALEGANRGTAGAYADGVPADRLPLDEGVARDAVGAYLRGAGAYDKYPGLSFAVSVDSGSSTVRVALRAPLDLPLTVPGAPTTAMIGATGSAIVAVDP